MGTNTHIFAINCFFLSGTFFVTPSVSVQASVPHVLEVSPCLLVRLGQLQFAVFTFTIAMCTIYFLKGN